MIGRETSLPSPARMFGKKIPVSIPPELADEAALLRYLGVSQKELKVISWYRGKMYRKFSIAKRSGRYRVIKAPDSRLKLIQRKLALLLDKLYRVRNPVHGFVPKRSVKSNAEAHVSKRHVINIDLEDFFGSITERRVRGLLEALGLSARISEIIARLCCYEGCLPQGAPTSPVISNMICFRMDSELLQFAKSARAIYTRYADDITFSAFQKPSGVFESTIPAPGKFSADLLAKRLLVIIGSNGFAINPNKVHYADSNARRVVTGLKINERINVDRRYVRNLRATLHSVETLGIKGAQAKFEADYGRKGDISAHLVGKISWLAFIKGNSDPLVRSIMLRYNRSFPSKRFAIVPTAEQVLDRSVWVVEHDGDCGTQGTCFFLKDVGLVTAAHCVQGVSEVEIYHPSKRANKFKAKVIDLDKHRDLALLDAEIPLTEFYQLEAADRAPTIGGESFTLGYPDFGPGDGINIRSGTISSFPTKSAVNLIEVTQKISQGMSGGPLINTSNQVIGVNHKGGAGEARDFAVHIDVLKQWLAERSA